MVKKNKTEQIPIEYYKVQEVADKLRVTRMFIYYLINSKKLPAYKMGSALRIKKSDLDKWIEGNATIKPGR